MVTLQGFGQAFAAHPLATEDASTIGAGQFELELGVERSPSDSATEGGVQLSWGVLSNLDLNVRPVWLWESTESETGSESESGLGDTTATLKWHVLDLGIWSFALQACAELPTGDASRGLGKNFVAWQGTAIATLNWEPVAVDANIGYEQGIDDELILRHLFNGQLAARWSASDMLQLVGEVGFERNPSQSDRTWPAAARAGLIATVAPGCDLDIGYQGRLNHAAPRQVFLAGVTLRW